MGNVFLAVGLSDDERHRIAAVLSNEGLAQAVPGRRTRPQDWHLTLCFVGEASETAIDLLAERTEAHLDAAGFRVALNRIGAFPRPSKATVVFLGVEDPTGGLAALAGQCRAAAEDAGFDVDARPFVPHLTLSRVRPPTAVHKLIAREIPAIPLSVSAVSMFRTERVKGSVRYEPMHRFVLS